MEINNIFRGYLGISINKLLKQVASLLDHLILIKCGRRPNMVFACIQWSIIFLVTVPSKLQQFTIEQNQGKGFNSPQFHCLKQLIRLLGGYYIQKHQAPTSGVISSWGMIYKTSIEEHSDRTVLVKTKPSTSSFCIFREKYLYRTNGFLPRLQGQWS